MESTSSDDQDSYYSHCDVCPYKAKRIPQMRAHKFSKHGIGKGRWHQCGDCPYKTVYFSNFKAHQLNHEPALLFCDVCPFKAETKIQIRTHSYSKHNVGDGKRYKCADCPYRSKHKGHLNRHRLMIHGRRLYQCEECDHSAKDQVSLIGHQNSVHGEGTFNSNKVEDSSAENGNSKNIVLSGEDSLGIVVVKDEAFHAERRGGGNRPNGKNITSRGKFTCRLCPFEANNRVWIARHEKACSKQNTIVLP